MSLAWFDLLSCILILYVRFIFFFFFQAEDGIRDLTVTGVQTCALPIYVVPELMQKHRITLDEVMTVTADALDSGMFTFSQGHHIGTGGWIDTPNQRRSEERRVGKECRSRWSPYH